MSNFCKFTVGQTVTNNELVSEFQCGNMGGMRRSNAKNSLILISDHIIVFTMINGMEIFCTIPAWENLEIKI